MTSKQTLLKALKEAKGAFHAGNSYPLAHELARKFLSDKSRFATELSLWLRALEGSLDACLALQERVLPGCDYELRSCGPHMVGARAEIWDDLPETGDPWTAACEHADTPALALLIAMVEALIAQEQNQ